jgi:hypothetical protein
VAYRGWKRNSYNVLAEKSKGKRLLGRPRHRKADNIKTNLKVMGFELDSSGSG